MDYTIEQKAVALLTNTLWWRYPESVSGAQVWTRMKNDLKDIDLHDVQDPDAEYHIGDKPPRVLSDLERELLAALEGLEAMTERYRPPGAPIPDAQRKARTIIAKAKGEA